MPVQILTNTVKNYFFRQKGVSKVWKLFREKKAKVVFGVTKTEIDIYHIEHSIYR